MSDFIDNYNNQNNPDARDIAAFALARFERDAMVIDGVVRWKNSRRVPPKILLDLWRYCERDFDFEKSLSVQAAEISQFISGMRSSFPNEPYLRRVGSYLGDYYASRYAFQFIKSAQLEEEFATKTHVLQGDVRWNSNNSVPPTDNLQFWEYFGKAFDLHKSVSTSNDETAAFLEEYRRRHAQQPVTDEERFEARAAFGPGEVVVNVISGRRFTT